MNLAGVKNFSIVKDDNVVCVDGDCRTVDLTGAPATVHAYQFNNVAKKGNLELSAPETAGGRMFRKLSAADTPEMMPYLDAWEISTPSTPAPEPGETDQERADKIYITNPAFRGMVNYIAAKEARPASTVWAEMKAAIT